MLNTETVVKLTSGGDALSIFNILYDQKSGSPLECGL